MENFKTHFDDLHFKPHPKLKGRKQAKVEYINGFSVSVIDDFDGHYEIAVLIYGHLLEGEIFFNDITGRMKTREQVDEFLRAFNIFANSILSIQQDITYKLDKV